MGMMVPFALEAAETLKEEGINAQVLNIHTVKPLDEEAVIASASTCGCVVTAEEHTVIGGLGGAVAEVLARHKPTPMRMVGIADTLR